MLVGSVDFIEGYIVNVENQIRKEFPLLKEEDVRNYINVFRKKVFANIEECEINDERGRLSQIERNFDEIFERIKSEYSSKAVFVMNETWYGHMKTYALNKLRTVYTFVNPDYYEDLFKEFRITFISGMQMYVKEAKKVPTYAVYDRVSIETLDNIVLNYRR
ncbi:hypothetical protein QJV45_02690 [Listeria booriae]|uniref:hypothetical protein n=1 Tax=Listeria booriae TaxID=1552123 RepID=UPI002880961C|nr:hypothetical protein [Listeria booriae]MDT0109350.1 hypothetical protein [Listeria booriae]